jgi:hypothetical protein
VRNAEEVVVQAASGKHLRIQKISKSADRTVVWLAVCLHCVLVLRNAFILFHMNNIAICVQSGSVTNIILTTSHKPFHQNFAKDSSGL